MDQLVQSAIEATKQGDKDKALGYLKQALNANPNDVDALMVLAAIVDDPERKNWCLNRVLTIDPDNQLAREELNEMNQAFPSMVDSQDRNDLGENSQDQLEQSFDSQERRTGPPSPNREYRSKRTEKLSKGKTLVFRFPIVLIIFAYILIPVLIGFGLFVATKNVMGGLIFLIPGLFLLIYCLIIFETVEIDEIEIKVLKSLSIAKIHWDDIKKIQIANNLRLVSSKGNMVSISRYLDGYEQIVEIVRVRRSDLFDITESSLTQGTRELNYPDSTGTNRITGKTMILQKNFFKISISLVLFGFLGLVILWVALSIEIRTIRRFVGIVGLALMSKAISPLFQVHTLKIEANQLVLKSIFGTTLVNRHNILDIKLQKTSNLYGQANSSVKIILDSGKNFSLHDFSTSNEIILGYLKTWFNGTG